VSGFPKGITLEVIDEFFSRAGVIRKDPVTGEKKIKLYKVKHNYFYALKSFISFKKYAGREWISKR